MKLKQLYIALVLLVIPVASFAEIESDKVYHVIAGGIGGVVGALAADTMGYSPKQSKWAGFLTGCAVGVAKEVYDKNNGGVADAKDALATCLGSTLSFTINFK